MSIKLKNVPVKEANCGWAGICGGKLALVVGLTFEYYNTWNFIVNNFVNHDAFFKNKGEGCVRSRCAYKRTEGTPFNDERFSILIAHCHDLVCNGEHLFHMMLTLGKTN